MHAIRFATAALCAASFLPDSAAQTVRHIDLATIAGQAFHATAYDAARERVVVYRAGQTWEWTGSRWLRREPARSPAGTVHSMAYDAARERVVLLDAGKTWQWDGAAWLQLLPVTSPRAGAGHSMAYDAARQRVVLFGGGSETWEWDGTDWQQRLPSKSPSFRSYAAMAYDDARRVTVLYGGYDSLASGTPRLDAWEWDGTSWQQITTAGLPAFDDAAMAYDSGLKRIVLFGSRRQGSAVETWQWDGVAWRARPMSVAPGRRFHVSVAHDGARGETVLCGGAIRPLYGIPSSCGATTNLLEPVETWTWDGAAWSLRNVGAGREESPRSAAYDTNRRVLVSFGSYERCWGVRVAYTREWDGRDWTQRRAAAVSVRRGAALVYDPVRQRTVMFGGGTRAGLDETWQWDGARWQQLRPATRPTAVTRAAMAFDSGRRVAVLFGGDALPGLGPAPIAETWEWDGTTWRKRAPVSTPPPARFDHAMAFDPLRGRTVLFGGADANYRRFTDTWEWDGSDWQQIRVSGPPAAGAVAMCWDPSRRRVVAYVQDRLWAFDGSRWSTIRTAAPLPPANGGAIAYDASRQALVATGRGITRLIGPVAHAVNVPVGTGCAGTRGVPKLHSELARIGAGEFRCSVDDVLARVPVVLGLSATQRSVAIGGGCTWYLGGPIALFSAVSNSYGRAQMSVPIPFDTALRGLHLWGQVAATDPKANALGLALSSALRLRIGD